MRLRRATKRALALLRHIDRSPPRGATILIYHRVGGRSGDELDLDPAAFEQQLDALAGGGHEVASLDAALDRLEAGDDAPTVVLTFDDGFADVHDHAFPALHERGLPFTLYLAAGFTGGAMTWEGSSSSSQGSAALTWDQLAEMHRSGLCTVANHTLHHDPPSGIDVAGIDQCSDEIERQLGARPRHFAWTWGIPVPSLLPEVRARFRSVATGDVGRNVPGCDLHALRRVPVRASDPSTFFEAKLHGRLLPERAYGAMAASAKRTIGYARRG